MTQVASNIPSLLKRVARVSVIAVFTASTLAMLGMKAADTTGWSRKAKPAAKHAVVATTSENVWDQLLPADNELVHDDHDDAAVAASAFMPAPAPVALHRTHTRRMEVTAYCPCTICCGPMAQGITASGKLVSHNGGRFVAADTSVLPFGTKLVIPGYADNESVEVLDRGGAIKGNKLDLYFPTHEEALQWGRQMVDVVVYE
jgi:3D (Asp-Asp-Asp) domain-containing protein